MKKWQYILTILCSVVMMCSSCIPPVGGLTPMGMTIICIFIPTMLLLIMVDTIWPVFLAILAFVVNDVYTITQATNLSVGNVNVWFVVFNGIIIYAMTRSGLLRRISIWLVSRKICRKSPWIFIGVLMLSVLLFGSIFNVTANIILFSTLAAEIMEQLGVKKGDRFAESIMMGILIFTGLSYGISPVGHTVAILAMSLFGEAGLGNVNFLQYMIVGFSVGLLFFLIYMILLKWVFRLDVSYIRDLDPTTLGKDMDRISKREIACGIVFGCVVLLWLLPGFTEAILPGVAQFLNKMGVLSPSIIGTLCMILIKVEGEPLVDVREALTKGVPWGAAFPMAAALLLGSAITNADAGITGSLGELFSPMFQNVSAFWLILFITLLCTIVTNFSSDTIACMLGCTIAVTILGSGLITGVNGGALSILCGICACSAYATAPGSTYSAYSAGQGWIRPKTQFIQGFFWAFLINLICVPAYYLAVIIL